jgi:hypothetical protein
MKAIGKMEVSSITKNLEQQNLKIKGFSIA